jgi:hypothetical protein
MALEVAVHSLDIVVLHEHFVSKVYMDNGKNYEMVMFLVCDLGYVLTIGLVVTALIVSSIVPSLRKLVVATLLAVLRVPVALTSLSVIVILVPGLVVPPSVLLEVVTWLKGLCSGLERTGGRTESASLLRIVVQVHLLCLAREVFLLRGRVIFPRIKIGHDCVCRSS